MRDHVKLRDGYMTVEAATVIPILLLSFVFMVYRVIYTYDKTLLSQDLYTMAVYGAEEYRNGSEDLAYKMEERFDLLRDERPYLAASDLTMAISKEKNKIIIAGSVYFHSPLDELVPKWFPLKGKTILGNREISSSDPVSNMLLSDDILRYRSK